MNAIKVRQWLNIKSITKAVEHREVFKQTGGRVSLQILLRIEPADEGQTGLQFIDEVKRRKYSAEYTLSRKGI